ncbi:MAG: TRAP transporter small permease, partial [Spirochaetota bacterium]
MKLLEKILLGIEKGAEWIVTGLIGLMVINLTAAVIARYVMHSSLAWAEELGRYMMVWCALLGAGLALRDDRHVGVSMFVELFPAKIQFVFKLLMRLVVMAFLAIVLVKAFEHMKTLNIQLSSALEIPMAVPYAAVPVGALFMFLENLAKLARQFVPQKS